MKHFYLAACGTGPGAGIHTLRLDRGNRLEVVARHPVDDLNYLLVSPDGSRLWGTAKTGLVTFERSPAGALTPLGRFEPGAGGCHLALDPAGTHLYVVSYHTGRLFELRLEDGVPVERTAVVSHAGPLGPTADRQDAPHPHCTVMTPDGRFLAVADLGLDRVFFYARKPAGGIDPVPAFAVAAHPGAGPRHLVFSPGGGDFYLVGELDNTVSVFRRSADAYQAIQTLSTLPAGFAGYSKAAAIRFSPDRRHLLVSNRGCDSIATYQLRPDRTLTLRGIDQVGGESPRDFNFLPDPAFLAAANEQSNSVTFFRFSPETGRLTPAQPTLTDLPRPLCIAGLRPAVDS